MEPHESAIIHLQIMTMTINRKPKNGNANDAQNFPHCTTQNKTATLKASRFSKPTQVPLITHIFRPQQTHGRLRASLPRRPKNLKMSFSKRYSHSELNGSIFSPNTPDRAQLGTHPPPHPLHSGPKSPHSAFSPNFPHCATQNKTATCKASRFSKHISVDIMAQHFSITIDRRAKS